MGASGKWVKALIGLKKPEREVHEKAGGKGKKWKLWRSSSGEIGSSWKGFKGSSRAASEASDSSSPVKDPFSAAVATVVRAAPKDFKAVRQEWAAIRIQTAFRGFLARRALRALKGLVRLQALVRGRQVRKQAAVTLRCMQALVRVQARVRARRVRMSIEGQAVQQLLNERRTQADHLKLAEEVKTKLQMRQAGALKRGRAMAYSLAQKQWKSSPSPYSQLNSSSSRLKGREIDKNSWGWGWLERWMAAKPWENRLMESKNTDSSEMTPPSKKCLDVTRKLSQESLEQCQVKVRKNNVTTRISAKPPHIGQVTRSTSSPGSEFRCDGSSGSSSICTSTTPASGFTGLASDRTEASNNCRPSYMNLTESTKAKQRPCSYALHRVQRQSMDEFQFKKSGILSNGDSKSSAGSDLSPVSFSKPLGLPTRLDKNSTKEYCYYD
ncbi:IQ motif, EF-hand binding site [Dillenia turbinata]|uniref:IQ motif, EF-hand binding site n=1 Tax=Dillenia turbinata TaxID=194707 RepID=A0AAN8ULZ5_9MAGN